MIKIKRKGYISIEAVIVAAIIMAVGFLAIVPMGVTGSQMAINGTDKVFTLLG